jgi:hypothetical protein
MTQITYVDHPSHSDKGFRRFSEAKLQLTHARLVRMWKKNVSARAGVRFTIAEEENALRKRYGIAAKDLPCLVLNTDPEVAAPIIVRIPDSCVTTSNGERVLLEALETCFDERWIEAEWQRGSATPAAMRHILDDASARLVSALDDLETRCGGPVKPASKSRQRRHRAPAKQGWIYLKDAALKYNVNIKTIYRYKNKLPPHQVEKDPDSHEIRVVESALKDIIDRYRS